MDKSLRALFEQAVSSEPVAARPLGRIIAESRKTGRRLRLRRRIQGASACVAGIAVVAAASVFGAGLAHRPSAAVPYAGSPGMAYVMTENGDMVPVNLATFRAGRPIKTGKIYVSDIIASRGDRTLYLSNPDGLITPISTATGTVGRPIWVAGLAGYDDLLVGTPNGELGYAVAGGDSQSAPDGVTPIDLITGTALKEISLPPGLANAAVSRNSQTAMFIGYPKGRCVGKKGPNYTCYTTIEVSLINVASQHVQKPISLSTSPSAPYESCVAMSPDGATAYVVYSKTWSSQNYDVTRNSADVIVPINVATDKPLRPIRLPAEANGNCTMAVAPNGKTAYVLNLSGRYLTPVNLVTGTAEKPIKLTIPCWRAYTVVGKRGKHRYVEHIPAGCDSATNLAIDPDGRMAYVIGIGGLTPVDLVTNTALPTISASASFLSFTPNGKIALVGVSAHLWRASSFRIHSDELLSIQAATGKVGRAIRLPSSPSGIVVAPSVPVALRNP
jgi:DNA-binding beta-propeller fold protein YncE